MADLNDITGLDYRARTTERTIVDEAGNVHVRKTQRCDDILEAVKGARDMPTGRKMRHRASIPLVLYHAWMLEAGVPPGDPDTNAKMLEVIDRKLQSNEFARLLVHGQ